MSWPLLLLVYAAAYVVFVVLLLRALTGSWPDLIVPGSRAAGPDESAWRAENAHAGLREQLGRMRARLSRPMPPRMPAPDVLDLNLQLLRVTESTFGPPIGNRARS